MRLPDPRVHGRAAMARIPATAIRPGAGAPLPGAAHLLSSLFLVLAALALGRQGARSHA